eukprot:g4823.t1
MRVTSLRQCIPSHTKTTRWRRVTRANSPYSSFGLKSLNLYTGLREIVGRFGVWSPFVKSQIPVSSVSPNVMDSNSAKTDVQKQSTPKDKLGIMLLNLGGPETLDDVEPFLYNLFADPDIIRLPDGFKFLQKPLARVISTFRASKSVEGYRAIGGGSPLRRITEAQGAALKEALSLKGQDADVYVAMRYWHPYTEEAMEQIKGDKITKLVVLPLYPQFSISTSGSSLRLLQDLLENDPELVSLKHTVIPSWYQRRGYVCAMADMIETELNLFDPEVRNDVEVFFSAHGVPTSYVTQIGDPYKEEMEECVELIVNELKQREIMNHHTLAYQSRVGPVEWLKPYTDDSIRALGAQGVKGMLAVPISFVSEHIETLEEIDMEYKELALSSGITSWRRVPALNTNPSFIMDLAEAVLEALPYVGSMTGGAEALVPIGEVDALLDVFDRDRPTLPSPMVMWEWGWTTSAEIWNGRFAMVAIIVILLLETLTGRGIFMNIFPSF